jgi:acyl carrier protein
MTMTEERRALVREAIEQHLGRRVNDDERLISSGVIDSLSIIRLIGALEEKLQMKIPTERVQPDDFDSVEITLKTVERVAK